MTQPEFDADVIVVGGGPVGLAAAIEAQGAGFDVVVVEPRVGVIDKACGEGLMPGAVPLLARLGVVPAGFELAGIDYRDGHRSVQHRFAAGHAVGVRRTVLHAALRERADQVGIRFVEDRVTGLSQDEDRVRVTGPDPAHPLGAGLRSRWLLGADGLHSNVARLTGLALPQPTRRRRYGQRRHYRLEPWTDLVEVHWTSLGELYITPVAGGLVGISVLARRGTRLDDAVAAAPQIAARLRDAEVASPLLGAGPFRQNTRHRVAGRVILIGDASGYVDALTAEGLRIGFEEAAAAVAAIRAGEPARFEQDWEDITRDFRRLTNSLVRLATSPARGAIVPIASAMPRVYASAVERIAR